MWLHIIYLTCLLFSLATAFAYRKSLKSRQLSLFPFYLLAIFAQELIAFLLIKHDPTYSTGYIYNISNAFQALFFASFYYRIPFNQPSRKILALLMIAFVLANLVVFSFGQSIYTYNSYLTLAGGFLIALSGILFLFNYFKLDNQAEEKNWLPVIWITIGLVSFYPVVNISFSLYKYLHDYKATILGMVLYRLIPQLMSLFMYVCFIRAFYLCKKKN
jgi:hypothetical protein